MSMSKFECRIKEDPSFFAKFIVNPKEALAIAEIQLDNVADVKRLEMFARNAQEQLRVAGRLSGFELSSEAAWGIGISCCNSKSLFAIDEVAVKRLEQQDADREKRILPKSDK